MLPRDRSHAMRFQPRIQWVIFVVTVGLLAWFAAENAAESPARIAVTLTAKQQQGVERFLRKHCVDCHSGSEPEADVRLDDLGADDFHSLARIELWTKIFERVESGQMPPSSEPRPTVAQQLAFLNAIETPLAATAQFAIARQYAHHGNAIEHRLLFDMAAANAPAASPPRVWRISPHIYRQVIDDLTGGTIRVKSREIKGVYSRLIEAPLVLGDSRNFGDYAFEHSIADSTTEQLALNARLTIEAMIAPRLRTGVISAESRNKDLPEVSGGERIAAIADLADSAAPLTEEQIAGAVQFMFDKLLRRTPTRDEHERYAKFAVKCVESFGNRQGLIHGLSPVFLHPEALFRSELGDAEAAGEALLSPAELAHAVAFALTDDPPDETLRKAADEGRLTTKTDVRREVERLLQDDNIEKPRVLRFFQEYFGYVNATNVFKDDSNLSKAKLAKHAYRPSELVEDTDLLVQYCIDQDTRILRRLLTTDRSYVASRYAGLWGKAAHSLNDVKGCKKEDLFGIYGFQGEWITDGPMQLPADERAGILTQPSWLVAYSNNEANNAILRGKWIRERLLGGTIPDVPIGVDAALPDEPHETLRHRMRVTREQSCWRCHQQMDPLGLPFEQFDFVGRFRTDEQAAPVDVTGQIVASGEPTLDGPVHSPLQLVRRLADSERVHQVFVRHAFRYWMGRNEMRADARVLQDAYQTYKAHDESLQALIVSLLSSDAFLVRSPSPSAPTKRGDRKEKTQ
jgi:hypothetical protein